MVEPRKVLIATPSYDGKVDVWYANSLVNAVRMSAEHNVFLHPVYMSYDALIQRARNDLIALAVNGGYDDIIFIDADIEFDPQWIFDLLDRDEDVVGGTYRKKTDSAELYAVKTRNTDAVDGLIKVEGLGTGFVKISAKAIKAVWDISPEYKNEGAMCRMVCSVEVVDGELYSEDTVLFKKLSEVGFDLWLDPKMTCYHIGTKKFVGSFQDYAERLRRQEPQVESRTNGKSYPYAYRSGLGLHS